LFQTKKRWTRLSSKKLFRRNLPLLPFQSGIFKKMWIPLIRKVFLAKNTMNTCRSLLKTLFRKRNVGLGNSHFKKKSHFDNGVMANGFKKAFWRQSSPMFHRLKKFHKTSVFVRCFLASLQAHAYWIKKFGVHAALQKVFTQENSKCFFFNKMIM